MRCNLNNLGYQVTKQGKVIYEHDPHYFRFHRIWKIWEKWFIGYNESGEIAKLTTLNLITKSFNILGQTKEVQEEAIKQLIIKTNLMAAGMDTIELNLKRWLQGKPMSNQ